MEPKRILVLQLKRIGDLLLTTPALAILRETFPDAAITLLTEKSCAGILPAIPRVHALARGQRGFWKAALSGADVCLDFTGTDRSTLLMALSRAKVRGTFSRFQKKFPHRLASTHFLESSVRERHTADHYTDLLGILGIQRENEPLSLIVPAESQKAIAPLTPALPYAVIHAGTARSEKYWLPGRWVEVATFLFETQNLQIVLTGSNDQEETAHLAAIQDALPGNFPAINLAGKTSLPELAAVIQKASLFCGVDTAAMHLADAMKTPCIALFGPTNPFHWRPRHTRSVIISPFASEPISPKRKGGLMTDILSNQVTAAISQLRQ